MEAATFPTPLAGPAAREQLFEALYEQAFPLTASYISRQGGNFQEAKDIFQDSLVLYYEKCSEGNFIPKKPPQAYILGIAKHLWQRRLRQSALELPLADAQLQQLLPAEPEPDVNSLRLLAYLEKSGRRCLDLLRAFYYEKLPMKQLAASMGYASDRSATVQKYKCLEKVREDLKEKSLGYEDFLN